jgi:preprotein translocase subunit SecD
MISDSNGVAIAGIAGLEEARSLAEVLRGGALPVRFEVVERPAFGG